MANLTRQIEQMHPGVMLLENFMKPRDMTPQQLADSIDMPIENITDLIEQRTGLSPVMACKLSTEFGVRREFWMNLQSHWDLKQSSSINGVTLVHQSC